MKSSPIAAFRVYADLTFTSYFSTGIASLIVLNAVMWPE
jgi:hypothetical protein